MSTSPRTMGKTLLPLFFEFHNVYRTSDRRLQREVGRTDSALVEWVSLLVAHSRSLPWRVLFRE
jgi:hypothetical protein